MLRRMFALCALSGARAFLARAPRSVAAVRSARLEGAAGARNDTLTGPRLATMLAEVRAHYRKPFEDPAAAACVEEAARVRKRLLRTRFQNLPLDRCEARASAVHGVGVFATRAIADGELITLYPGDALLLWPDADPAGRVEGAELNALFGAHVPQTEQAREDLFLRSRRARSYELAVATTLSIVGDPARDADPAYLGHLANDGAAVVAGDVASRDAYETATAAASNAAHMTLEGCHQGVFASRAIAAGDEVLVTYGEAYWRTRAGFAARDAKNRAKSAAKKRRLPGAAAGGRKTRPSGFG